MNETRYPFTDPVSNQPCHLVIPEAGRVYPQRGEPKTGVAHPGCDTLADLAVMYDAFWCTACQWNGRISGAWAMDMISGTRNLPVRHVTYPLDEQARPNVAVALGIEDTPEAWAQLAGSVDGQDAG